MSEILIEEFLVESKKENGKIYLEGIAISGDRPNKNKRLYPYNLLKPEVDRYIKEEVNNNSAYGELSHPDRLTIDLSNISHRIVSLKEDGKFWISKSSILDTPKGNIVKAIVEDGGNIGMSTRGGGSVKKSKSNDLFIVESFSLKTIDLVLTPSVQESVMTALREEKETFFCESEQCYMLVEDINDKIKKASKRDLEKVMLEQFERYCKALNFLK